MSIIDDLRDQLAYERHKVSTLEATLVGHDATITALEDEIDRLRAENIRLVNLGKQMIIDKAVLRTERDVALEKLGECHAGYETMERQLAAARAEALEEAAKFLESPVNLGHNNTYLANVIRALASGGGEKGAASSIRSALLSEEAIGDAEYAARFAFADGVDRPAVRHNERRAKDRSATTHIPLCALGGAR